MQTTKHWQDTAILDTLGLSQQSLSRLNIEHFTEVEGTGRDQIVLSYFGVDGLKDLVSTIVEALSPVNPAQLLDLGSGAGTFLFPVATKLEVPLVLPFDATPKMLELSHAKFAESTTEVLPVLGDMEQVNHSLELNRKRNPRIPQQVDAILSTLAFHHIPDTEKILQGMARVLSDTGKAVIIDAILSDYSRMEPSEEHAHDGFDMEELQNLASKYFATVELSILDIKCQETASADGTSLFLMELSEPVRN